MKTINKILALAVIIALGITSCKKKENIEDVPQNPVEVKVVKPRYIASSNSRAYVSCWGNADWNLMNDSYIIVLDLSNNSIIDKINLPGGPEGLVVAKNKLYAALNYRDSIAVIDLSTKGVSYIETPAVSSYFLKDNNENLYVSFVSTYSDPSSTTGIGYINTTTDSIESIYSLSGISSEYGSMMQFNSDKSKIYVIAAAYDANWVLQGGINVFNTTSSTFETPFLENITGISGLAVNPKNDNIYLLTSVSTTEGGSVKVYDKQGILLDQKTTEISPNNVIFNASNNTSLIANYGSYSGSKGEISIYNEDNKTITNSAYKTANGIEFSSNIQYMNIFNGNLYIMSNDGDKIDVVNANDIKATINPITKGNIN